MCWHLSRAWGPAAVADVRAWEEGSRHELRHPAPEKEPGAAVVGEGMAGVMREGLRPGLVIHVEPL